jgi:hypothetical protein
MIKTSLATTFPLFYIVEAAVNPDDIKTTIIRENTVTTAEGGTIKTITADATLQSFMMLNWNGRTYPAAVVMEGMDGNPKIQNDIRHKQFAGEWGHPDSKDMVRQSQILPEYTSHYIDSYRREGNLLKGHVTSAPFGRGLWMYNTIMAGRPWAFSLRAFGAVDSNNQAIRPLTVITYDQVNRPSHKEAYATSGDVVGAQSYSDSMLKECSTSIMLESSTIVTDITNFVLEKSDNVKIAKELFGLQESAGFFNGKNNIILEGNYLGNSIKVTVPLESYVRDIYRDILTF